MHFALSAPTDTPSPITATLPHSVSDNEGMAGLAREEALTYAIFTIGDRIFTIGSRERSILSPVSGSHFSIARRP